MDSLKRLLLGDSVTVARGILTWQQVGDIEAAIASPWCTSCYRLSPQFVRSLPTAVLVGL